MLADPVTGIDKIVRCRDIPVAQQAELIRRQSHYVSNAIGYVLAPTNNLSKVRMGRWR